MAQSQKKHTASRSLREPHGASGSRRKPQGASLCEKIAPDVQLISRHSLLSVSGPGVLLAMRPLGSSLDCA